MKSHGRSTILKMLPFLLSGQFGKNVLRFFLFIMMKRMALGNFTLKESQKRKKLQ